MITEQKFLNELAKIVLRVFDDPELCLTKDAVCRDGHFSPKMLSSDRLLHSSASVFMRLMLYLALLMNKQELDMLFLEMADYISQVADEENISAYDIIDAHAGSPVGRSEK